MAIPAARGSFGDLGTQPHRGERRLDRIGGTQVNPILGRVLVELQEHIGIVDDLGGRHERCRPGTQPTYLTRS